MSAPREFGCDACWPDDAAAAWAARDTLARTELVDESHYHVALMTCRACGQRFVSLFTEQIDWTGGEDPQYSTQLPLTADEAAALVADGAPSEAQINALDGPRRSLKRDFPKGGELTTTWGRGIWVGWHD